MCILGTKSSPLQQGQEMAELSPQHPWVIMKVALCTLGL